MTKQESKEITERFLDVYAGVLFGFAQFENGAKKGVEYDFDCPEFTTLKEKYGLEEIAARGDDFTRAKRLLHYLAPRLHHDAWYDNRVPCNALDLLAYSLNNPERGINCLNKSKILEECCLALGIYARRVAIMPQSPYDFDNHVVTEIYDRKREKWIMLDPTTDGYFVDENKTPLSLTEMRKKFAADEFVTFAPSGSRLRDLRKLREKYADENAYICKNLFYFVVDKRSRFGAQDGALYFLPKGYSIKASAVANHRYRLRRLPDEYAEWREVFEEKLAEAERAEEPTCTDISVMEASPIR